MARNLTDLGFSVTVLTAEDPADVLSTWQTDLSGIHIVRTRIAENPKEYGPFKRSMFFLYRISNGIPLLGKLLRNICFFFLPMDHHLLLDISSPEVEQLEPDVVIASGGPWSIFESARIICDRTKAELYLDYRDPWNVYSKDLRIEILQHMGSWPLGPLKEELNKKREERIGRSATGVISVSPNTVSNSIIASGCKNACLVYNGFGDEQITAKKTNADRLVVTFTGTINKEQCFDILIHGIEEFYQQFPELQDKVVFNLIGVLSSIPEAISALLKSTILEKVNATKFVPAEESKIYQASSDLLMSVAWRSLNGILGSKFFEYLKAGKPILLISEKDDGKETILYETGSGVICRNVDEFAASIKKFYDEKIDSGQIAHSPNRSVIEHYSYKNQMRKLATFIDPNAEVSITTKVN